MRVEVRSGPRLRATEPLWTKRVLRGPRADTTAPRFGGPRKLRLEKRSSFGVSGLGFRDVLYRMTFIERFE